MMWWMIGYLCVGMVVAGIGITGAMEQGRDLSGMGIVTIIIVWPALVVAAIIGVIADRMR